MNIRLVFNPYSHKAGYLWAPRSHKYLNLLLGFLVQTVDLSPKVFGKLSPLCFQGWCQEPVFNGKWLRMKIDVFDLGGKMHAYVFNSDVDGSAEPCKCYGKNLKEYFPL